ncbi:hypothetical protein NITMOv2_0675 [Nitrospira moscoviensis]|uniref:GAF domain-containing protein n=1 Tax=Nitrospira moscoviensis TaxID=42253 RepID=A0A0K2G812_NITMO|nr:hypothetical protein NITMOv2_0675 [Nitrospira moscoviensis]
MNSDSANSARSKAEGAEQYLKPLGISSMLGAHIRLRGRVVGVVCHEHVGAPRT